MDFISNRSQQIKDMLKTLGLSSVEELFHFIPASLRLPRPLKDDGMSEYEGLQLMQSIAAKNRFSLSDNYLGAGAYEHYVPALVESICSQSEFLTAYTPYQPEASQGWLQAIFEFQSAICAVLGMDCANASVYDAAAACAEGLLMAMRHHKQRKKLLISSSLHPHYQGVIRQYVENIGGEIVLIPKTAEGTLDMEWLDLHTDETCAAILFQSPNFFGILEEGAQIKAVASKKEVITICCTHLIACGWLTPPGEWGIDIAVGDCQPLGIPLQFGGPYAGFMACRTEFLRQLPGRLVGQTSDRQGRRGFVLTLQTREQHIRREKATSNICTNQALAALACLITLLWYGKEGLRSLAITNYQRAAYLKAHLACIKGISIPYAAASFNEFVVSFDHPIERVLEIFRTHQIEPGVPLNRYDASASQSLLVAVTETKSLRQLQRYLEAAKEVS